MTVAMCRLVTAPLARSRGGARNRNSGRPRASRSRLAIAASNTVDPNPALRTRTDGTKATPGVIQNEKGFGGPVRTARLGTNSSLLDLLDFLLALLRSCAKFHSAGWQWLTIR